MTFRARADTTTRHRFTTTTDALPLALVQSLANFSLATRYLVQDAVERRCTTYASSPPTEEEAEEAEAELSAQHVATLHGESYAGEHFVYLMTHSVPAKIHSFVGFTTNPLTELFLHNRRRSVDRNTCSAAPHWELDIVLGPFVCRELAIDCGHALVTQTRGKEKRREKAPVLSHDYNAGIYTYRVKSDERLETLLARHAPPVFGHMLRRLRTEAAVEL
jgi:hypothetical protein